jgi:hypothetical protein
MLEFPPKAGFPSEKPAFEGVSTPFAIRSTSAIFGQLCHHFKALKGTESSSPLHNRDQTMKTQATVPLFSTLAPAALAALLVVIVGVLIGVGLLWLLSCGNKEEEPKAKHDESAPPVVKSTATT